MKKTLLQLVLKYGNESLSSVGDNRNHVPAIVSCNLYLTERFMLECRKQQVPRSTRSVRNMANRQFHSLRIPSFTDRTIGRRQEIADLQALLRHHQHRLVTVVGPGGVGKTRLAIEVAESLQDAFDLGAHFLTLAPVRDPARLPHEVQIAFGLSSGSDESIIERIASSLGDRSVLIVFDNLEQIIEAGVFIHDLVSACETVTAMVTSRIRLRVTGEYVYEVPPLGLPEVSARPDELAMTDAVALFRERANHLTDSDLTLIAEICRRLDGLPLAIELAAARARVFRPSELLDRLDERLPMLTQGARNAPSRLQSMAAAIAWSYDLLSEDEQRLFRMLSVFEGGFTMEAAEAMAPGSVTSPIDLVSALADHSLIQRQDEAYGSRFIMLETVKEYGLTKLKEHGEVTVARDNHSALFAGMLRNVVSERSFSQRRSHILQLPGEHENLRAAINWALVQHRPEQAADLADGLSPYWNRTASSHEAVATWEVILEQCQVCPDEMKALIFERIGGSSYLMGDFSRARSCATAALDMHRMRGFLPGVCACLSLLGLISRWSDPNASVNYFNDALSIAHELGDDLTTAGEFIEFNLSQSAISLILAGKIAKAAEHAQEALARLHHVADGTFNRPISIGVLGWIAGLEGNLDLAEACGQEQLALSEQFSVKEGMWYSHRVLGEVAYARRDLQLALSHFKQSLDTIHHSGIFPQWRGFVLAELAMTAFELGDTYRSAQLWGSAVANWDRFQFADSTKRYGATWTGRTAMQPAMAANERVGEAIEKGRTLNDTQSYAVAMDITGKPSTRRPSGLLTRRQLEVLELIAEGRTNKEIAETLFISKRTVDGHVTSVMDALGVADRRTAANEAHKRRLMTRKPHRP